MGWEDLIGAGTGLVINPVPGNALTGELLPRAAANAYETITGQPHPAWLPQGPAESQTRMLQAGIEALPPALRQTPIGLAGQGLQAAGFENNPLTQLDQMLQPGPGDIPVVNPSQTPPGPPQAEPQPGPPPPQGGGGRVSVSGPAMPGEFRRAQQGIEQMQGWVDDPTALLSGNERDIAVQRAQRETQGAGEQAQIREEMGQQYRKQLANLQADQSIEATRMKLMQASLSEAQKDVDDLGVAARYAYADKDVNELRDLEERARQGDKSAAAYLSQVQEPDPTRIFKSGPLGGWYNRIMAALAVGLGSIGASLTGGPNHAAKLVDDILSRDLGAQLEKARSKKDAVSRALNQKNTLEERAILLKRFGLELVKNVADTLAQQTSNEEQRVKLQTIAESAPILEAQYMQEAAMLKLGNKLKVGESEVDLQTRMGQTRASLTVASMGQEGKGGESFWAPGLVPIEGRGEVSNKERIEANALLAASNNVMQAADDLDKWRGSWAVGNIPGTEANQKMRLGSSEIRNLLKGWINNYGSALSQSELGLLNAYISESPQRDPNFIVQGLQPLKEIIRDRTVEYVKARGAIVHPDLVSRWTGIRGAPQPIRVNK